MMVILVVLFWKAKGDGFAKVTGFGDEDAWRWVSAMVWFWEDGSLRVMVSGKRSRALTNSNFCCKRRIERELEALRLVCVVGPMKKPDCRERGERRIQILTHCGERDLHYHTVNSI